MNMIKTKSIFTRYLLKRFCSQTLLVLASLAAVLLLFDLLTNAEDVTVQSDNIFFSLLFYLLLRIPAILTLTLPMSVLIGAIFTFAKLSSDREMIAMETAGLTLSKVLLIMMSGVLMLSAVQIVMQNTVGAAASGALYEWKQRGYAGLPDEKGEPQIPNWFTSDSYIINISSASKDGHSLKNLVISGRDKDLLLNEYFTASKAVFERDGWILYDVYYKNLATAEEYITASMPFKMTVTPVRFSSFSKPVEALRTNELWLLGKNKAGTQNRPSYYYAVWFHHHLSQPLGAMIMVLIAAPIALILARRGGLIMGGTLAIAGGFFFFVTEKILLTLGENGQLPVILAAWGPMVIFGLLAGSVILYKQS